MIMIKSEVLDCLGRVIWGKLLYQFFCKVFGSEFSLGALLRRFSQQGLGHTALVYAVGVKAKACHSKHVRWRFVRLSVWHLLIFRLTDTAFAVHRGRNHC